MKLLIVAATQAEIAPFMAHMQSQSYTHVAVSCIVTGVGMVATTYALTRSLQAQPCHFALQVGVGGSFTPHLPLGSLVKITTDGYGDLGAEDHDAYLDITELGLLQPDEPPFTHARLAMPASDLADRIDLPDASGLTVNTVSGGLRTIALRWNKYCCDIESMEGAAFHYVCLQEGVSFAQVRAVSNYVTPRDKSQWKMKESITNLNEWLIGFVAGLDVAG
jgi:futalosine hydrolase